MKTTVGDKSTPPAFRGGKGTREGSASARRNFLVYAANMSWQLAVTVIVPVAGGAWLDKRLHAGDLWVFVGLAVALAASTAVMWRTIQLAGRLPVPKLTAAQRRAIRKSYEEEEDDE